MDTKQLSRELVKMRYAGTRPSKHHPLRTMLLVRRAAVFSGPTEADRLVGDLRSASWSVAGFDRAYDAARAAVGASLGESW